jgi:hypothetical protein
VSIYSSPTYQLGATQIGGQLGATPVTVSEKAKADAEIRKMRRALEKWLRYRKLLGTPATDISPIEARMGKRLYVLLSELFDAQSLPSASRPLELAEIAVAGKLPGEAAAPTAVGFIWLWPAVAVIGLVLMTVVVKIKSDADDAADARKQECIMAGKCTDTGLWLKLGAIAVIGWLAWDKFGLREKFKKV